MSENKTANKNQYSNRVRRAEQCWLIANLNDIVDDNPEQSIKKTYKHSFNTHHITLGEKSSMEQILGKYFIGSELFTLFDLSTEELSSLVPQIRLYRVDLNDKGKIKKNSTKEFFFPQHVEKSQVEAMIKGEHDRFSEAGISSVSWDLLGGQPADAKRYVQVKLELFFSSLAAMTQIPYASGRGDDVSYFDLFRRIGDNSYRLRMDVGWTVPPETMYLFENDRGAKIIRALKKSNKTLWLHLKDHDLDFDQNGTVKVSIDYISSLEYDMQNISIIKDTLSSSDDPAANAKKKKILKRILSLYENSKCRPKKKTITTERVSSIKYGEFGITRETQNSVLERKDYEKTVRKMKSQIKKFESQKSVAALKVLRKINENLEGVVNDSLENPRTRVFSVAVDPTELGYVDGSFDSDINWSNKRRKISAVQSYKTYKKQRKSAPISIFPYFSQVDLYSGFKNSGTQSKQKYQTYIDNLYKQMTTKINGRDPAVFKFCFLGDIIDAVIEANVSMYGKDDEYFNSLLTNLKIVFGHVILPTVDKEGTPVSRKINLSDLPISYNLFNAWFIRNVVDKGRTTFSFKDFLRKIITELVTAAFGSNCLAKEDKFFKKFPKSFPEVTFSTVRIPRRGREVFTKKDPTVPLSILVDDRPASDKKNTNKAKPKSVEANMFLKRMTGKKIRNIRFREAPSESSDAILTNYMFINTRNYIYTRKRNIAQDLKDGIFHFRIGQDAGLVKKINFSKIEAKNLEAALLTDKRNQTTLDQIRRVYNATIELYGNSSFIPGQMVYIDPTAVGFGDPSSGLSVARQLGLGGYFIVVKVNNSISRGDYSTTLTCRWVSFGSGGKLPRGVKNTEKEINIKGGCSQTEKEKLIALWNQNCDDEFSIAGGSNVVTSLLD